MDRLTPQQRSRNMSRIRARDTAPELAVRQFLHRVGYRYRLHAAALPGRPDLVFPARRKVIFVHGCFWHQHSGCPRAFRPASRQQFWQDKFRATRERDARVTADLAKHGWQAFVVWECETRQPAQIAARIGKFLGPVGAPC